MNIGASAALQARSIFALMLRQIRTRYIGSRAGYAWALIEPIVWVFVLKLAIQHNGNMRPPVGTSFEVFFATAIILARTWRTIVNAVSGALLRSKRQGLPTLHRLDAAYALGLLEAVTGGIAMIISMAGLQIFGFDAVPGDLFACLVAFFGMTVFGLAFGLAFALLLTIVPALHHFKGIILLVLFVTSGFGFVIDRMAPALKAILLWNPVLHCNEWFREGFYAGYQCLSLDLVYLFSLTVICLLLGLVGERAFRRRAAQQTANFDSEDV